MLTVLVSSAPASAQSAVDTALLFYSKGGAYCFRVAPSGIALSEEREWTVMMLTSAENHHNTFRIRSVDPGEAGLNGHGLQTAGRLANDVWKFDGSRSDFFQRFADGIRSGKLRARVVKAGPPNLAQIDSDHAKLEKSTKLVATKDALRAERDDLKKRLAQAKTRLLPGGTVTLGAAALQERTNSLAQEKGIAVQSTQVMKEENLDPFRKVAVRLMKEGRIVILRKGRPVDPDDFRGTYRLALPPEADS